MRCIGRSPPVAPARVPSKPDGIACAAPKGPEGSGKEQPTPKHWLAPRPQCMNRWLGQHRLIRETPSPAPPAPPHAPGSSSSNGQ
jgi:hypothetical protein